jgi:3D (Asp-Asp-Asp) domain-containing protein
MVMPTGNTTPPLQAVVEQSVVNNRINFNNDTNSPYYSASSTKLDAINTQFNKKKEENEKKKAEEEKKRLEEEARKHKEENIEYTEFELTFYTSLDSENGFGAKTCQGKPLSSGIVANNVIPQNTKIHLEGYGQVTVADKGGSNFNTSNRLDVYVGKQPNESNAHYSKRVSNMGRKIVKGYIIK